MLSRILYLPFLLATAIALYLTFEVSSSYSWYIIPPFMIMASIFFLQPQIDWWWDVRHPPKMNAKLEQLLQRIIPFYAALPPEDKQRFQNRVELYVRANAYIAKGLKEDGAPPEEVVYFIATCITQITFGMADFRLPKFERIVVYPAPFPSPQYPTPLHASEIFVEDGVIIFAVKVLMDGVLKPEAFNIGMYEYAQALIASYPEQAYARPEEVSWEILEKVSGFSEEKIRDTIGLPEIDLRALALCHYLNFPQTFQEHLPELYQRQGSILNLDRLQSGSPIVDRSIAGEL